eukprot:NP_497646.1 Uncharacterized protein CELE_Y55D5A.2 [Caenorhabditis elegans]
MGAFQSLIFHLFYFRNFSNNLNRFKFISTNTIFLQDFRKVHSCSHFIRFINFFFRSPADAIRAKRDVSTSEDEVSGDSSAEFSDEKVKRLVKPQENFTE